MGNFFRDPRQPAIALALLGLSGLAGVQALARQTSPIQTSPIQTLPIPPVAEGPVMTAEEVKAELFGVEVVGDDDGRPWRECIAPEGKSVLYKDKMVYHGTVYVSAAGYQCFLYDEQPGARWCWRMIRNGTDQYINELPRSGSRQTMRIVRKKVKECSGEALIG